MMVAGSWRSRFLMGCAFVLMAAGIGQFQKLLDADWATAAPAAPISLLPPLSGPASAPAADPATHPAAAAPVVPAATSLKIAKTSPAPGPYCTDAQIGQAIEKGADYLMKQFVNSKLSWVIDDPTAAGKDHTPGEDALAVYALEQCGMAIDKPELDKNNAYMKGLVDTLKKMRVREGTGTYTRGLRLTALSLYDRKEDRDAMVKDVEGLLDSCHGGGYTYGLAAAEIGSSRQHHYAGAGLPSGDNSNSQYGLLGVWSAAEIGAEIPNDYWQAVETHWTKRQLPDGQWCYGDPAKGTGADWGTAPRLSMTCAGLASVFVCHDYLDIAHFDKKDVGREPFSPPQAKGLEWFETGDNCIPASGPVAYTTYGVERVGLASGFKYFGTHDWYREIATRLVKTQAGGGNWNSVVDTCYDLLFLSRGRHPILMNKLRFEHFWANRPRDVANLATYATKQLEHPFNWQVVTLSHDWNDWMDSPILYIASHEAAKMTDADFAKLRAYVNGGGMLFTQADGDMPAFTDYVAKVLVPKVFPEYGEMTKVPLDHPVYSAFTQMKIKPPLSCISNGARLLLLHSSQDLSMYWQQKASKSHRDAFDLGLNLFVYAAGKRDFQNRLATNFIDDPPAGGPGNTVAVARVKYALPTWDPEPYAWERFRRALDWETSVKAQTQVVDMDKLGDVSAKDVPLAHLTGTMPYAPNAAQLEGLTKYVENGGILFIDVCGGGEFNESAKKIMDKAFPGAAFKHLPSTSPLLTASAEGMTDCTKPMVRPYSKSIGMRADGFTIAKVGKGQVIFSTQDVTNGLLGSPTWGINGYDSKYCLNFMQNLVLWAARGAPDAAPVASK